MTDVQTELCNWIEQFGSGEHSLAELLCDRHAEDASRLALRYEDAAGCAEQLTYGELADQSARLAARLAAAGIGRGDRVATLLPKRPELLIATVGLWRLGAVHVPLFTAFGPDAIAYRLDNAEVRVVITDAANEKGNSRTRPDTPGAQVLLVDRLREQLRRGRAAGYHRKPRSGRSADPDLHLGHHRAPERGRGACSCAGIVRCLPTRRPGCARRRRALEHRRPRLG